MVEGIHLQFAGRILGVSPVKYIRIMTIGSHMPSSQDLKLDGNCNCQMPEIYKGEMPTPTDSLILPKQQVDQNQFSLMPSGKGQHKFVCMIGVTQARWPQGDNHVKAKNKKKKKKKTSFSRSIEALPKVSNTGTSYFSCLIF